MNLKESTVNGSGLMTLFCHPVATFLAALRFLTILPVRWGCHHDGRYFAASIFWFPAVGLFIGLAAALVCSGLLMVLPDPVALLLALLVPIVLSGALHLDGLADSADGLLSSRPREQILLIMRDSRIGSMGVVVLFAVLLVRFTAIINLPESLVLPALILMPLAGRTAILFNMALFPYARAGEGLGRLFYSPESRLAAGWSCLLLLAAVSSLAPRFIFLVLSGVAVVVLLFGLWCRRKIGGTTGDTLGAVSELTETIVVLIMTTLIIV
ncbi:MAG: adenosylcobinamide-GDP ribazoletransferase [Desulfobulbaceae bacterium]|uniref:Adenosylcobinamide-GDP ribazoletransferase n=1 Tax=Candidatus Desulfatifera sulfidica TaxID=2841691 RepID=A0A8J6N7D0_9BACT|nr:adenosylcobinamide-GDP ribazoletransferase [Candidatus Desulfatifera sulfidica]